MLGSVLERILYVDDEPSMRLIVQVALQDIGGYSLLVASSGAEALSIGPAFLPQLILLDVMMPDLDGPETLSAMRKVPELADVPVLFFTAMDDEAERAKYKMMDVVDIISKPIDPMSLSQDVADIWDKICSSS